MSDFGCVEVGVNAAPQSRRKSVFSEADPNRSSCFSANLLKSSNRATSTSHHIGTGSAQSADVGASRQR